MMILRLLATIASLTTAHAAIIKYDEVEPFPQPEALTVSEKAAVKFKPQLRISSGCHSYAAVNAAGDTSSGADTTSGWGNWVCRGPKVGSQVYGRSAWHKDVWAIMYAWYFPMDEDTVHAWENVVVWIDNPALEAPTILGVSAANTGGYLRYAPPERRWLDGDSFQIRYELEMSDGYKYAKYHDLDVTWLGGDFQDLIMWDQLTGEARTALQNTDFGDAVVPFKDGNFTANLAFATPFSG